MVSSYSNKLRDEISKFERELDPDVIQQVQDEEHIEHQRNVSHSSYSHSSHSHNHHQNNEPLPPVHNLAPPPVSYSSSRAVTTPGYTPSAPASRKNAGGFTDAEENNFPRSYSQMPFAPPVASSPHPSEDDGSSNYCICGRSDGDDSDYIGCDNDNCRIAWYHLACVGLKAVPKGEWFCPECRAAGFPKK
jgi:inhibitor of growth protein 3